MTSKITRGSQILNKMEKSTRNRQHPTCMISSLMIRCPTGMMEATACANGMHELSLVDPSPEMHRKHRVDAESDLKSVDNENLQKCYHWLECYFDGKSDLLVKHTPKLCPLVFNKETFYSKVWLALFENVTFGETVTYGELAGLSESPKAFQAVGSAMRNNPVSLIVPCHRVIKASGQAGNYAGGKQNDIKAWLLKHESEHLTA